MRKSLLLMAAACSVLVVLAGCEQIREQRRLDKEVRRLCAKDGGVKVYETVKLPPEEFDRYVNGRIPYKENAKESDPYYYALEMVYLKGGKTSGIEEAVMWRHNGKIIRRSDGKVLGESISYTRFGGDIPGPWHPSSFSCRDINKAPALETSVFVKENEK